MRIAIIQKTFFFGKYIKSINLAFFIICLGLIRPILLVINIKFMRAVLPIIKVIKLL